MQGKLLTSLLTGCILIKEIKKTRNPLQLSRTLLTLIAVISYHAFLILLQRPKIIQRLLKPQSQVLCKSLLDVAGRGGGAKAKHPSGWADLPFPPLPSPLLANTAGPMHPHDPWIPAPEHGWGDTQSLCWSLPENERVSEVPELSFCGPNIIEEVALREALGTMTASGLANVLQLPCPMEQQQTRKCSASSP